MSVLIILDGASEPVHAGAATSLERADTPTLDALAAGGDLAALKTTPDGLPPGSEVAIPVLLGWIPPAAVARGPIEAAARGIAVPPGAAVWRVDVVTGDRRASVQATRRAARALRQAAPGHAVHALAGHRLLLVGPPPLPADARDAPFSVWPDGERVPCRLDATTTVIAAAGAAAGIARLMGAHVVVPDGATGGPDSDLRAKAACAVAALANGASRVVVHAGGADEAAHARDPRAKVTYLERADRELIAPVADAVGAIGGSLQVCADHGCDPASGRHDAEPVPSVTWPGTGGGRRPPGRPGVGRRVAAERSSRAGRRLTERAAAACAVVDLTRAAVAA